MIGSQKSTQSGISYTVELISEDVKVRINRDGFKLEGVRLYGNGRVVSGIQKMPSTLLRKIGSDGIRTQSLIRRLRSEEQYILNHEGIHNLDTWVED